MRNGFILACLLSAALAGCNSSSKTSETAKASGTVNHVCPVAGEEFGTAPGATRTWKSSTVGFCCNNCANKFDKMTDTEKDNVMNVARSNKAMGQH